MLTANEPITHRESALWADMRRVQGDELFSTHTWWTTRQS